MRFAIQYIVEVPDEQAAEQLVADQANEMRLAENGIHVVNQCLAYEAMDEKKKEKP